MYGGELGTFAWAGLGSWDVISQRPLPKQCSSTMLNSEVAPHLTLGLGMGLVLG